MGNRGLWLLILPSFLVRFQCFLPNSESEWTEYSTGCSCFVLMFTLGLFSEELHCLRRFKSNMLVNLLGQWQVGDVHKWKEGRSIHPHKNAQNTGNDFHCLELENVTHLQFSESLESPKARNFLFWKGISWWLLFLIFIRGHVFTAKEADFGGQSIPVGGFAYYISPPNSVTWLRRWLKGWRWVGGLKKLYLGRSWSSGRSFQLIGHIIHTHLKFNSSPLSPKKKGSSCKIIIFQLLLLLNFGGIHFVDLILCEWRWWSFVGSIFRKCQSLQTFPLKKIIWRSWKGW